jgi:hypothetical protein
MRSTNAYPTAALGAAVLLGSVVAAVPAHAGGGDFIEETGTCSMGSTWVMKAKHDTGRIELEFSVDSNRAGQTWSVRVTDNRTLVFTGNRVTNRISRSFSVDRMLADRAGTDTFRGRATNAKTGELCRGQVALGAVGSGGGSG